MAKKKKKTAREKAIAQQHRAEKRARKKKEQHAKKVKAAAYKSGKTAASKSQHYVKGNTGYIKTINRAVQQGRQYAINQAKAEAKLQRTRLRNERSNKRLMTSVGKMIEGKKSQLDRTGGDVATYKGLATLYYYENYWRAAGSDGMKNWTQYAAEGYASEHNMEANDVNLWQIAKKELGPKLNQRMIEVMDNDNLIEWDEFGRPTYKGEKLKTTDDMFQAMIDSGLYTPSDLVALVRSVR